MAQDLTRKTPTLPVLEVDGFADEHRRAAFASSASTLSGLHQAESFLLHLHVQTFALHHHSVVSRPGQDSVGPSGEGVPRSVESQLHSMMHDSAQWQSAQLTRLDGISGCGRHG